MPISGANVGYYMQSFDKGRYVPFIGLSSFAIRYIFTRFCSRLDRFNYHQIKFMVDTLEARGETPLVIIPNKYAHHEFFSSRGENQRLDRAEIEIMDDLTKSGKLYKGEFGSIVRIGLVGTHSHVVFVHFAFKQSLLGVSMTFIGCSLAYQTKPHLAMDRIYLFQTMTLMDDFRGVVQC